MPFVISSGELAPVRPTVIPSMPMSVTIADGVTQEYSAIWRTQPQVRTVVSFLARNIAQIGLKTYRRVSDTDRERLTDHPLAVLLGRPTPRTTTYRYMNTLVSDLAIFDNAISAKIKVAGQPRALQRLDPRFVWPKGDNPFDPDVYEIRGPRGFVTLPADQVVHIRGYNPDDTRWGVSPMETLRAILAEEYAAAQYRAQLWRNSARMSGYLRRPMDAPKWPDGAKERFRSSWQSQYAGSGPLAGGTPILEDGMDFVPAASSARDAQYIESRKLTREEVASAYHIPLPMVGILDHATFSNIKEQHKQLYQDCLGPWLEMIQQEIELQLLPDFPDIARVYVEFNLAEKMRGSFEEQASQIQTSVGAPWMTRNEARAMNNLPALDGGDELVTPLNVISGGQASPTDSAPPPKTRSAPPVTKAGGITVKARAPKAHVARAERLLSTFFTRQGSAVASQLGRAKTRGKAAVDDVFDVRRWNAELSADLFGLNVGVATAAALGALSALELDPDSYDEDRTLAWLQSNADGTAEAINGSTRVRIDEALADADPPGAIKHLFEVFATARAAQIALSQVTSISGFGTTEAARQLVHGNPERGKPTKTWRVRSLNPRKSHKAINGETVGLNEQFSNGGAWPGDRVLDDDQRMGCTCDLEINFP